MLLFSYAGAQGIESVEGNTKGIFSVAHRTCWQEDPENSLKSIERCMELGIDMVEVDVRRTLDGRLVLMHDETLDRTTNGVGKIANTRFEELRLLNLKNRKGGNGEILTGEKIPSLEEVIDLAKGKIILCLDVKEEIYDDVMTVLLEKDAIDDVLMLWLKPLHDLAGSQLVRYLDHLNIKPSVYPNIADKRVTNARAENIIESYLTVNPVALTVSSSSVPRLNMAKEKASKEGVLIWVTTNKIETNKRYKSREAIFEYWDKLVSRGVNIIQSDRAEDLSEFVIRARNKTNN